MTHARQKLILKKAHTLCTAHDGKREEKKKYNHKKNGRRFSHNHKEPSKRVSLIAHSFGFTVASSLSGAARTAVYSCRQTPHCTACDHGGIVNTGQPQHTHVPCLGDSSQSCRNRSPPHPFHPEEGTCFQQPIRGAARTH